VGLTSGTVSLKASGPNHNTRSAQHSRTINPRHAMKNDSTSDLPDDVAPAVVLTARPLRAVVDDDDDDATDADMAVEDTMLVYETGDAWWAAAVGGADCVGALVLSWDADNSVVSDMGGGAGLLAGSVMSCNGACGCACPSAPSPTDRVSGRSAMGAADVTWIRAAGTPVPGAFPERLASPLSSSSSTSSAAGAEGEGDMGDEKEASAAAEAADAAAQASSSAMRAFACLSLSSSVAFRALSVSAMASRDVCALRWDWLGSALLGSGACITILEG
jgi:hypothetical protein